VPTLVGARVVECTRKTKAGKVAFSYFPRKHYPDAVTSAGYKKQVKKGDFTMKSNLKLVAMTDAQMVELARETIEKVSAIGTAEEFSRQTSEDVALAWLPVYELRPNFKTGKADVRDFCERIYSHFGDMRVQKKLNPNAFLSFATIDKLGVNAAENVTPEQVRAARGLRAVEKWLSLHVDELVFTEEPLLTASGEQEMDKETGVALTYKKPIFRRVVNAEEKEVSALLSKFEGIKKSELILKEEHAALDAIFSIIAARIRPAGEAGKAERIAALDAMKAEYAEVAAPEAVEAKVA
jgi:hypothetical protein